MSKNIIIQQDDSETTVETSGDDNTEWLAFMAHIAHSEVETIEQELQCYKYIIGLETSEYEHMHFYVNMSIKQYSAFAQRIFRKKYNLLGRATKGCPRQYGREHNIKSQEKIARYTCKDQNVRSNMTKEEIDEVLGMKLEEVKNTKKKSKYDEMMVSVEKALEQPAYVEEYEGRRTRVVKIAIIQFMREQKMVLRKTTIDSYYYYFRCNAKNEHFQSSSEQIYEQIYNDFEQEYNYA